MSRIFMEYDVTVRNMVSDRFNLTKEQCDLLVKAYDDICVIGGLLYRSDIEKEDIRYLNDREYYPLPRIMREIVNRTKKDMFASFFSPFKFKDFFEKFVESVLKQNIRTGADILGVGVICYKKQKSVNFQSSEFGNQ